jgi:hypothetical protein
MRILWTFRRRLCGSHRRRRCCRLERGGIGGESHALQRVTERPTIIEDNADDDQAQFDQSERPGADVDQ